MTKFRGCIDIHNGVVKQIVGGTLDTNALATNHVSSHPPSYFSSLYSENSVTGTHVIKLGPGCDEAAEEALAAWPHQLQIGGGITAENANAWITEKKASKVIVTSYLFPNGKELDTERLEKLFNALNKDKEKLVIDLSCRKRVEKDESGKEVTRWFVATNRWQTITNVEVNKETLKKLAEFCSEFLIHAADVEGLCKGIDQELVEKLGEWTPIPTTYAGGAKSVQDLELVDRLSNGKVDLTFGSALDIFGGDKVKFQDCIEWNKSH